MATLKSYQNRSGLERALLKVPAWIFGQLASLRGWAYQKQILKSFQFDIPVISVGNLSVGGSGKTPMVRSLLEMLSDYKLGTLSRGYKRKTSGYIQSTELSRVEDIGDEPCLIKYWFPKVPVAVCEDRVSGVAELLYDEQHLQGVILDDAMQHQRLKPSLSILLTPYHQAFDEDYPIPAGRLREFPRAASRADILIVTACPADMSSEQKKLWIDRFKAFHFEEIFFAEQSYGDIYAPYRALYQEGSVFESLKNKKALLLSALADAKLFEAKAATYFDSSSALSFQDHQNFDERILNTIKSEFEKQNCNLILTTEKDWMRLREIESLKSEPLLSQMPIFVLPYRLTFSAQDFEALKIYLKNHLESFPSINKDEA
jgi:tetraacyldisaccharide 4'-kinase